MIFPSHNEINCYSPEKGFYKVHYQNKNVWYGQCGNFTLLLEAAFGDGDFFFYWRFIDQVRKMVDKVVIRCNQELKSLFNGIYDNVELFSFEDEYPEFDQYFHMMALPNILDVDYEDVLGKSYIEPKPVPDLNPILNSINNLKFSKIGITWSGNPYNPRDSIRSIDLNELSIFDDLEHKMFSLNRLHGAPNNMFCLSGLMLDWNHTANFIKEMDLVISVETSIAMLSAAMGVETWMMVPNNADARWSGESDRTNWFKSMTIFRNKQENSWTDVLNQVKQRILQDSVIRERTGVKVGV